MGYLVPLHVLISTFKTWDYNKQSIFLGSHRNVALGVLSGDFIAGAVKEEIYLLYKNMGLKEVISTPEIYEHLFLMSENLEIELKEKICSSFFELNNNKQGKIIFEKIKPNTTGIAKVQPSNYFKLIKIFKDLKKAGIIK